MTFLLTALVTGLSLGAMYGLIALGFQITYSVCNRVNFAQGSMVMLGAVLGYVLTARAGLPPFVAYPLALVGCALMGMVVEFFLVRPFGNENTDAWLMATVAGGILLDNSALFTFGNEPRALPSPLVENAWQIAGVGIYPQQLLIPVVAIGLTIALQLLFRHTRRGRALLAVVQNPEAAQLMGIDTKKMIALAFAISAALAGIAGLLIAPLYAVHSDMGTLFGIKAFAVAILGGMTSASGVMIAGLLFGLVEALVTTFFGSSYTYIVVFGLLITILAVRPNGLFGTARLRKV